ncbi:MAG: bifunctional DNA primase/polymerase [Micromonosporaceae bacterium]|nr:bifunctional DNA primase/polymerase [Micromonosporaceae bacterium]
MASLLAAAHAYAQAGIPVLPLHCPTGRGRCSCGRPDCGRAGKHPRWHPRLIPAGLHDASTDPARIDAWWSTWPTANIGLRTGVACDVCDIDTPEGLRAVQHLLGGDLPTVRTGSGGYHVYLAPTGAGNRARLLPGVDWRGAGGYVVAPPSRHASGERYRWIRRPDGPFPACPPELLRLLSPAPVAAPPSRPPATVHHPMEYAAAALRGEESNVRTAPVGARNTTLYHAARSLGRLVGAGLLDPAEVTDVLTHAARAAGLGRAETARTIRSGLTAACRRATGPAAAAWSA